MSKRVFDLVVTVVLAPLWVPLMLAAALALAITFRGNPFFLQTRVGLHGKTYTMYKLRTMRHARPGEDDKRVVNDFGAFVFSPADARHPRLTRLGAMARKLSLDELPNLINVLKGEMSLVGPRPEVPAIVDQYPEAYYKRLTVPPGITGLAQVSGRSDLPYHDRVTYDLKYVDEHSFRLDLWILWRTLIIVPFGSGAR